MITDKGEKEVGRTEVIMDNLNPEFVKPIEVDFFFEEEQTLRFDVYDQDDATNDKLD